MLAVNTQYIGQANKFATTKYKINTTLLHIPISDRSVPLSVHTVQNADIIMLNTIYNTNPNIVTPPKKLVNSFIIAVVKYPNKKEEEL